MEYEWDERKSIANIFKHNVSFSLVEAFDWDSALIVLDDRRDYEEPRYTALGFVGDRLYVCIYTWRGQARRIISLRKANERERKAYHEEN